MGELVVMNSAPRDCVVVAGPSSATLAAQVGALSGATVLSVDRQIFPDGESVVRVQAGAELDGARVVIVHGTHPPQHRHFLELCQLIGVAWDGGAAKVECVVPYFAYPRQDRCTVPGEAVTFLIALRLLFHLGVERLACVEIHNPTATAGMPIRLDNLLTRSIIADWVVGLQLRRPLILSPDRGRAHTVRSVASDVGCPALICQKEKLSPTVTLYGSIESPELRGADVVVLDDLASTGSTLVPLISSLHAKQPRSIRVFITHALCSPAVLEERLGGVEVFATDTIPGNGDRIGVASLIADWVIGRTQDLTVAGRSL